MTGTRLGHYRVLEKLGAGGMGEVYRAHDEQLDRDVAIKVVPTRSFEDAGARARLLREARAAAALIHPSVCTIHEVGEADGQAYIVMELVDGVPLSEKVPGHALATDEVLRYGIQIADALAHAHARQIVHRKYKCVTWDWAGCERAYARALELNPNLADAHFFFGHLLLVTGRTDESNRLMQRGLELDPLNDFQKSFYGWLRRSRIDYQQSYYPCRRCAVTWTCPCRKHAHG